MKLSFNVLGGIILSGIILSLAHADSTTVVSSTTVTSSVVSSTGPTIGVYAHMGPLNMTIPWDNPQVTYLFDIQSKTNLVGGEMPIASIWKFSVTAGAVTSLQGVGAPFVGLNLQLPSPIPQLAGLAAIHPGAFGGFNFTTGKAMFGFKASVSIFN